MASSNSVVVIPVYKETLSTFEIISLEQTFRILNKHDICLIAPDNIDIKNYKVIINKFSDDINIMLMSSINFSSISSYNAMMMSVEFYERFLSYEFMLICQLDCFVFSDECDAWCAKGYDYIGAPWFEGFSTANINSRLKQNAGNGGFSLRKVSSFIRVLKTNPSTRVLELKDVWDLSDKGTFRKIIHFPGMVFWKFSYQNKFGRFLYNYLAKGTFEDLFFSIYAPKIDPNFRVASPQISMYFSFECLPRILYERTERQLPFGCHAWPKYDLEFWRPFIEKEGYIIPEGG